MRAEVLARLDDLHRLLGPRVVDALGALVEARGCPPSALAADDLDAIRPWLGERYLKEWHAGWMRGEPSPGFWRDRSLEGTATGVVTPLGELSAGGTALAEEVAEALARANARSARRGVLLLSRNAHLGNQPGSFALDLVPSELAEALALDGAAGRHHTLPGSVGETSGRALGEPAVALVWEIQPNLFKPSAGRSPEARRPYRRYRDWPLVTAVGALAWLRRARYEIHVLRGAGLRAAHEVDPARPLGDAIAGLHDRTVAAAARALGMALVPVAVRHLPEAVAGLSKLRLGEALAGPGGDELVFRLEPISA